MTMAKLVKDGGRLERAAERLNQRLHYLDECQEALVMAQDEHARAMKGVQEARAELAAANEAWQARLAQING